MFSRGRLPEHDPRNVRRLWSLLAEGRAGWRQETPDAHLDEYVGASIYSQRHDVPQHVRGAPAELTPSTLHTHL
jgi:hypothetical protein